MTHVSVRPSRTLTDGWDIQFQDVGGERALRRATRSNPRDRPCGDGPKYLTSTAGWKNRAAMITHIAVHRGQTGLALRRAVREHRKATLIQIPSI